MNTQRNQKVVMSVAALSKPAEQVLKTAMIRLAESHEACDSYRGPRGARCAIGMMIPDDIYREYIEGNGVASPEVSSMIEDAIDAKLTTSDLAVLSVVQNANDYAYNMMLDMDDRAGGKLTMAETKRAFDNALVRALTTGSWDGFEFYANNQEHRISDTQLLRYTLTKLADTYVRAAQMPRKGGVK